MSKQKKQSAEAAVREIRRRTRRRWWDSPSTDRVSGVYPVSSTLELTRFRGYLTTWGRGVHDGKNESTVPG